MLQMFSDGQNISHFSISVSLLIDFLNPLCTAVANYYFFFPNTYFMLANALEKSPRALWELPL